MSVALLAMSHSPLIGNVDLDPLTARGLDTAFEHARQFVEDFAPELVIVFGPDHYNGFFYNVMPPFCLGCAATSIGDYGGEAGALDVPEALAMELAEAVLDAGIDLAVSMDMQVDHGIVQPLQIVFGSIRARPVVPIFVNGVAPPFPPMARVRLLGEAVGKFVKQLRRRVLIVASGGLSHDPPVPRYASATAEQRRMLLGHTQPLSLEARRARQKRVIDAAGDFANGRSDIRALAPEWDETFLNILASGELTKLDSWTAGAMAAAAGNSAHEVRTWLAAYAALAQSGRYSVEFRYYRPIEALIAGFAVTVAMPIDSVTPG